MPTAIDALGREVTLARSPTRVISLVPSITASVAALHRAAVLVGVTKFCIYPPEITTPLRKVGGTKNPNLETIRALQPDLILANVEENRREDIETLIAEGWPVFLFHPRSVADAETDLETLARLLGAGGGAAGARRALREERERQERWNAERPVVRVFCAIWRNPYMAMGPDTYGNDLLRLAGGSNVFAAHPSGSRYPQVTIPEIREAAPDIILLPDEPFPFRERHRAEILGWRGLPAVDRELVVLCPGWWLTWHDPRSAAALRSVEELLDRARPDWRAPDRPDPAAEARARYREALTAPPTAPSVRKPPPTSRSTNPAPAARPPSALPPGLQIRPTTRDVVDDRR